MTNRTKIILAIFLIALVWFLLQPRKFEIRNSLINPAYAAQEQILNFGSYGGEEILITQNALWGSSIPFYEVDATPDSLPVLKRQLTANNGVVGADLDLIKLAHLKVVEKWGESEWLAFYELAMRESGFNPYAVNPYSGAYGIPQCLPVSKCLAIYPDFLTNPEHQIDWMISYIANRFGTPSNALYFQIKNNWY